VEALWREGRPALGPRARRPGAGGPAAELRAPLAAAGRGGARHQQVQQQRDGAAALPDAGRGAGPARPATPEAARQRLRDWLAGHLGEPAADAVLDNGSGLSREYRISAQLLARLLQQAWTAR
jgi:serine-type D-Ala-D-Ala carboxypeptidase/endopeptidase (penicillin-binding protein 4)